MNLFKKFKQWFSSSDTVKNEKKSSTDDTDVNFSEVIEVTTEEYVLDVDYESQDRYYRVRSKNGDYECKIYKYTGDKNLVKRLEMRRAIRKQYAKDTGCPYIEVREMLASNWVELSSNKRFKTA